MTATLLLHAISNAHKALRALALTGILATPLTAAPNGGNTLYMKTNWFHESNQLRATLEDLVSANVDIDEMAVTHDGKWIVIAGDEIHKSSLFPSLPSFIAAWYMLDGKQIDVVAVHPNGSSVVVAEDEYQINGSFAYNWLLRMKLEQYINAGQRIRDLAFDADGTGWALTASGGLSYSISIPSGLREVILDRHASGRSIKQISISKDGRWCVLADDWYATDRVHANVAFKLSQFQRSGCSLDRVMLGSAGDAVLYSHGAESPNLTLGIEALEHELGSGRDTSIFQRMKDLKVAGVGLAVIEDGQVRWARGYGELTAGKQVPVLATTPFDCASVSKGVGTLGILAAMDCSPNGFDLDDSITDALNANGSGNALGIWVFLSHHFRDNLPPLPIQQITLRRLLSHTAGMAPWGSLSYSADEAEHIPSTNTVQTLFGMDVNSQGEISYGNSKHVWFNPQVRNNDSGGNDPAFYDPGDVWHYSGGGMQVAAAFAEAYTGEEFRDIVQERVLDPLGMENSTTHQPLAPNFLARVAKPHDINGQPLDAEDHPVFPWAIAGGLYSSPEDLGQFVSTLIDLGTGPNGAYVAESSTVMEMLTDQVTSGVTSSVNYGLGMKVGSGSTFYHAGDHAHARTHVLGDRASRVGLVVMVSGYDYTGDDENGNPDVVPGALNLKLELVSAFKRHYGL